MINRCILHIGLHKTGSSSIQDSLHLNLDDEHFYYAKLDLANHSEIMMRAFIPAFQSIRDKALGRQATTEVRDAARARIRRELEQCRADTIIFSAESLTRPDVDIQALHDFLREFVRSFTVVGYVRSLRALLESGFQEFLKERLPPEIWQVHYRGRLEKFDQIFGRENVELWKFEPKQFKNGCVVTDFCNRLGVPLQAGWVKRSNESLSRPAVAVLYAYRKLGYAVATVRWMVDGEGELVRRLYSLKGPRLWFSDRLARASMNEHQESINWAEKRMGVLLADQVSVGAGAIDSLSELLVVDEAMRAWLRQQSGQEVAETISVEAFVQEVESLVRTWGNYSAGDDTPPRQDAECQQQDAIIRAVFSEISAWVGNAPQGELRLPGFGRFVIRQVVREQGLVQQVLFYPYQALKLHTDA